MNQSATKPETRKKNEEDTILDFVFENEFLKLLYKNRCRDLFEPVSIDSARIFLSEYTARNGEAASNSMTSIVTSIDLSNMKIGLNCIYALTQFSKKNKSLKSLNLGNNMIKDYGLYCFREFFKNTQLEELNLSSNMITGPGLEKVMDLLIANKKLKTLNLGVVKRAFARNNLGYEGARCLAELLKKHVCLESLYLEENNFDEDCLEILKEGIQEGSLLHFSLRASGLKTKSAISLITGCEKLQKITLAQNRLKDEFGSTFREVLAKSRTLEYLDVSGNRLTHLFLEEMLFGLKMGGKLKEIHLGGNDLSKASLINMVGLVIVKGLRILDLENCGIGNCVSEAMLKNLNKSDLEKLNLGGNDFSGEMGLRKIVDSEKVVLKKLELRNCKIDNKTFMGVFEFCKSFPKLSCLDFSNNLLSEEAFDYIFHSLEGFKDLKSLKLGHNRFSLHQIEAINKKLKEINKFSKNKRPKLMMRKFNKLVFEKENIEELNREIRETEEILIKGLEKRKSAEIEETNRVQNVKMVMDQLLEKIEKQKKMLAENKSLFAEKEKELEKYKEDIRAESAKQFEGVGKNQIENESLQNEKIKLMDAKKVMGADFDAEYFKRMNLLQDFKDEIVKVKMSSEFYAAQISSAIKLTDMKGLGG